jgi:hypothetical protein
MYLGLAAMEVLWLYPLLAMLWGSSGESSRLPLGVLLGMLLLAHYAVRWMEHCHVSLSVQRVTIVFLVVASGLLLVRLFSYPDPVHGGLFWLRLLARDLAGIMQQFPAALLTILAVSYLWWRGIRLAQNELSMDGVGLSFRAGIVAFLWFLLAAVFADPFSVTPFIFGYFTVGLFVVAAARIEDVSENSLGIRSPFGLSWLVILFVSVLLVMAASALAAMLFTTDNIALAISRLQPVWSILGRMVHPISLVLGWLLDLVFVLLVRLFSSALGGRDISSISISTAFDELMSSFRNARPSPRLAYLSLLKWVGLAALLLGVLAGIAFTIGRRKEAPEEGQEAEHQTVFAPADLSIEGTLAKGWHSLQERLETLLAGWRGDAFALETIRQVYASLVRLAAAQGFRRREAETPYEFIGALERAFPGNTGEIRTITEAYVQVHYGMCSVAPEQVRAVRAAWLSIRARQAQGASH